MSAVSGALMVVIPKVMGQVPPKANVDAATAKLSQFISKEHV